MDGMLSQEEINALLNSVNMPSADAAPAPVIDMLNASVTQPMLGLLLYLLGSIVHIRSFECDIMCQTSVSIKT